MRYNVLIHGTPTAWDNGRRRWLGGGGNQQTTSQVQYSPEETAQRNNIFQNALGLFNAGQGAAYPGAAPVEFSQNTLDAQQMALQQVPGMNATAQNATNALNFNLHDVLYPGSNPALQGYIDSAVRPITESFTDPGGVMGQIRTGAGGAGQFGSSRQGVAEGVAAGRYASAVGDTTAKIANEAYGQGLDAQGRALALAPQTQQMATAGANVLGAVGNQQELYQQDVGQYAADQALWGQNQPWTNLQNYANVVYGGSIPTSTTNQSGGGQSTAGRLAGAASAGVGTASLLTTLGASGPVGWGVGAMVGLASLFS